jgi:preprotein translocase subunit SecY
LANETATLGKSGKFGDLKRRLMFLLGALIVYRIGAHIPVPGIDPERLAELFQGQQGGILGIFNLFSGGALSRFTILRAGHHALHLRLHHHAVDDGGAALAGGAEEGRRGRAPQDHPVHPLRYGRPGLVQGLGIAIALESQAGLVIDPGHDVPHHLRDDSGDRDHVPDVAGRADHRARPGQRHFHHHFRRHCRGLPNAIGGLLELVRTGAMHALTAIFILAWFSW